MIVRYVPDTPDTPWENVVELAFLCGDGTTVRALQYSRTDFCSVPRIPGAYELFANKAPRAGNIHDGLYDWPHSCTREQADGWLREMLLAEGMPHAEAETFYLAVREFGEPHWALDPSAP